MVRSGWTSVPRGNVAHPPVVCHSCSRSGYDTYAVQELPRNTGPGVRAKCLEAFCAAKMPCRDKEHRAICGPP